MYTGTYLNSQTNEYESTQELIHKHEMCQVDKTQGHNTSNTFEFIRKNLHWTANGFQGYVLQHAAVYLLYSH